MPNPACPVRAYALPIVGPLGVDAVITFIQRKINRPRPWAWLGRNPSMNGYELPRGVGCRLRDGVCDRTARGEAAMEHAEKWVGNQKRKPSIEPLHRTPERRECAKP